MEYQKRRRKVAQEEAQAPLQSNVKTAKVYEPGTSQWLHAVTMAASGEVAVSHFGSLYNGAGWHGEADFNRLVSEYRADGYDVHLMQGFRKENQDD